MEGKLDLQSINQLKLDNRIVNILKEKKIKTLGQLCQHSKKDLKNINIFQNDVKQIEVQLQLMGLALKGSL